MVQEKIPCLRQKLIKSIPCLDKNPEKYALADCTSPLSPYKGVPLPPRGFRLATILPLTA